ncbi:MAG: site-specific integrase [Candidatus Micrarchaeota archaeon]
MEAIQDYILRAKKWELERTRKLIFEELRKRYARPNKGIVLYGSLNKGFNTFQIRTILNATKKPKLKLAFTIMAFAGLRVGEVVRVKLEDVDFNRKVLRVRSEKGSREDFIPLVQELYDLLKVWCESREHEIRSAHGHVLYSGVKTQALSKNWIRNELRQLLAKLGIQKVYGIAKDSNFKKPGSTKRLNLYSTHSFRHFFVTQIYKQSKDVALASRAARHRSYSSTQTYIHNSEEELRESLEKTFK